MNPRRAAAQEAVVEAARRVVLLHQGGASLPARREAVARLGNQIIALDRIRAAGRPS